MQQLDYSELAITRGQISDYGDSLISPANRLNVLGILT